MLIRRPLLTGSRRGRAGRERHVCRTDLHPCGVVLEVWREMLPPAADEFRGRRWSVCVSDADTAATNLKEDSHDP